MNKTALVIGGSRGIGRSTSLLFAERGLHVVSTYRTRADAAHSLSKSEDRISIMALDIESPSSIDAMVRALGDRPLEAIVANAGSIPRSGGWPNSTFDSWASALHSNVGGHVVLLQKLMPLIRRARTPSIVFVGSVYGEIGAAPVIEYAASKAAVESVVRALSVALAPDVRVNAVVPGNIDTDMTRAAGTELVDSIERSTPMRRLGRPEEIAEAIYFLASPAASFVTGASLVVDGGFRWT